MPQIEITFDQIWLVIGVMSSSNIYLATGIAASIILYFAYGIYNNLRVAIGDVVRSDTRVASLAILAFLTIASLIGGYLVVDQSLALARRTLTPVLNGPEVVIRDVGLLSWNVPDRLGQPDLSGRIVYDVQASESNDFGKIFRSFRTNSTSLQIPAGYNKRLFWRVQAGMLRSSSIFEDVEPVGDWSNVVTTEHYASVFDRIARSGQLRALTSTNNFTGIYKFYSGKLFRGVEPMLMCSIADSLSAKLGRKIAVVNSSATFTDLGKIVGTGSVDVASASITISAERERLWNVSFSTPYAKSGMGVISNREIRSTETLWSALTRGKLAIHQGRISADCGRALRDIAVLKGQRIEVEELTDINDGFRRLAAGQIDHLITDLSIIEGWTSMHRDRFHVRSVAEADFAEAKDPAAVSSLCWAQNYGIMARRGEEELLMALNQFLQGYRESGKLADMEVLARSQLLTTNGEGAGAWARQASTPEGYCQQVLKELDLFSKKRSATSTASVAN